MKLIILISKYKGIRQWSLNRCTMYITYPIRINKDTPFLDLNYRLKSLKSTNKNTPMNNITLL